MLYCDSEVKKLFWEKIGNDYSSDSKFIHIKDIIEVRAGIDIDPQSPLKVLETAAVKHNIPQAQDLYNKKKNTIQEPSNKSLFSTLVGLNHHQQQEKDGLLYGTPILRRTCKTEDLSKCFSLITSERYII